METTKLKRRVTLFLILVLAGLAAARCTRLWTETFGMVDAVFVGADLFALAGLCRALFQADVPWTSIVQLAPGRPPCGGKSLSITR